VLQLPMWQTFGEKQKFKAVSQDPLTGFVSRSGGNNEKPQQDNDEEGWMSTV